MVASDPVTDPYGAASVAADAIRERLGDGHTAAVVLGSGWGEALGELGESDAEVRIDELPGFPEATVAGHRGTVISVRAATAKLLVFAGRLHMYEGHRPNVVVHGVRAAILAGCRTIVLTNAAGGIDPDHHVGQTVLISDHLNLTGCSPMAGPAPPADLPARFVDLTETYSPRLRAAAREIDPSLRDGVYACLSGPHYETPAEVRMVRALGADLVGMSTVLEAIAARHLGAELLALSIVTNAAAGLGAGTLDHTDVLAVAHAAATQTLRLVGRVLEGT